MRRNGSNGSNGHGAGGGREEVDERGCSALAAVSLHPPASDLKGDDCEPLKDFCLEANAKSTRRTLETQNAGPRNPHPASSTLCHTLQAPQPAPCIHHPPNSTPNLTPQIPRLTSLPELLAKHHSQKSFLNFTPQTPR